MSKKKINNSELNKNTNDASNSNECNIDLEKEYKESCNVKDNDSSECNKFQIKKELAERKCLSQINENKPYLYPNLNDPNFIIKIAEKKEFNDTQYDGFVHEDIKKQADILADAPFELQPHQAFVKNFMSFQTPYNSLLLYHGLGSGKTCSAIGVCEEMRDYMKQMDLNKQIIIVASSNVQDNFRLQLFDERKLKLENGIWTVRGCLGNKLLKEINPTGMKNIPKDKIISQIKALINHYYLFLGYGEFANYIIRTMYYGIDREDQREKRQPTYEANVVLTKKMKHNLRNIFDDRLVVIDEIHNIRNTDDNKDKKVAIQLEYLVKATENMRFLFLSATPMYNSYKEIIWLINIMNMNDKRGKIDIKEVFNRYGDFKNGGEDLLRRKSTGYVSFVRGENPYTFPFRVYPNDFAPEDTFPHLEYPKYQMNGQPIYESEKERIISLYLTTIGNCKSCGECQYCAYRYIINNLKNRPTQITTKKGQVREMPSFENMESFGYSLLQTPLESLIISYPIEGLKEIIDEMPQIEMKDQNAGKGRKQKKELKDKNEDIPEKVLEEIVDEPKDEFVERSPLYRIPPSELTGKNGLKRIMQFVDSKSPPKKGLFKYRSDKYDKIFSYDLIGKYSSKIKSILNSIYNRETNTVSDGIILIYSQYIDGGLIPVALALEEMGFTRYGKDANNLFENRPTDVVDVTTMKPPADKRKFMPARYSMITGDVRISPDNDFEVKGITDEKNKDGNMVKVVLISKAGSEGIDLKFIRQVHILDPWYNMNRLEQIIGRAVRNFSHKDLPFEKRNVQIFMYGTLLEDNKEESADLYVYRVAEYKAIQIGKVSRLLKESAVDCILNYEQTNFRYEKMKMDITQELSTGITATIKVGDQDYSQACDFMECKYDCNPMKKITEEDTTMGTYNEAFVFVNAEKISQRIKALIKESFFYKRDKFIKMIQTPKDYPEIQIYAVLSQMIDDENEYIEDRYGRTGHLVNIGDYYLFQPLELTDKNISIYDRSVPIDYKNNKITIELDKAASKAPIVEAEGDKEILVMEIPFIEDLKRDYNLAIEFFKETKVPRGDDNWYKHSGIVMNKMAVEDKIPLEDLVEFLVDHILDLLLFKEKLELMNYLYSLKRINTGTFEWHAKQYFTRYSITSQGIIGYIMYNLGEMKVMKLSGNKWVEAEYTDTRKLLSLPELEKPLDKRKYNKIVGFLGYEKHFKYLVFKTKDMEASRDTGARCDEAGKTKTLALLNTILGEEKYTKENTKIQKDETGKNVTKEAVGLQELCVIEEFTLRYYNKKRKDGNKYFFTPEMAIYFELYKIHAK